MKLPASAATEVGAERFNALQASYPRRVGATTVPDLDADTPQPVLAYVSLSFVYVVNERLDVIAFGRLVRRACE